MRTNRILACALLLLARAAMADVWIADEKAIHKLDPAAPRIALSLPADHVKALAVDPRDNAVWVLTEKRVARYSSTGAPTADVDLKLLGLEDASLLAIDARDGSAWIGDGNGAGHDGTKVLLRLDSTGTKAGSVPSPGDARALAIALDGSVWVLGKKRALHFTSAGSLLADIDLKPLVAGEPKLLQVDSIGAWLWASAEKRLIRIDAHTPSVAALSVSLPKQPESLALDEIHGVLWFLSGSQLGSIVADGSVGSLIDLNALGIRDSRAIAFDSISRTVLVGHKEGLSRFLRDGAQAGFVANGRRIEAIGVSPLVLETSLSLVSPPHGVLTNQPAPPISLQLQALCSGTECGFAAGFYQGYSLSVNLSGQQVGPDFVIDRDSGLATYRPPTRLPEGVVSLSATATDGFGLVSPALSASFTIDTVSPSFLTLLPASPFLTNQSRVPVTGRLSEPATLAVGATPVGVAGDGSFLAEWDVVEGLNAIILQATDLAGNTASRSIAVTLDTVAPKFTTLSPPDGAIVETGGIAITGSVDESSDIVLTSNGAPQASAGQAFRFDVTLAPGTNNFQISATDKAGNSSRKSMSVTYVPVMVNVTVTVEAPVDGATATTESVVVRGVFTGPPNTTVTVNGVAATLSGQAFSAMVVLDLGFNAIGVVANAPSGASAVAYVVVTREDDAPAPTITFHSPANGETFVAPANIAVMVSATSADGSFAWVEVRNDSPTGFSAGVGESGFAEHYWNDVPEGTYEIIATVANPDGSATTKSLSVTVLPDPLDQPFIQAWKGMNDALRAGDKAGAMGYLNDSAKAKYGPVFDALMGHWTEIINSYSPLVRERLDEDIAEFVLSREVSGLTHVYFIYFLKNPDGTWLIDAM